MSSESGIWGLASVERSSLGHLIAWLLSCTHTTAGRMRSVVEPLLTVVLSSAGLHSGAVCTLLALCAMSLELAVCSADKHFQSE